MRIRLMAAVVAVAVAVSAGACVRTVELERVEVAQDIRQQAPVRTATNLPAAFTVVIPARSTGACPPRLRDPDIGVTLELWRAMTLPVQDAAGTRHESFGDYRMTPAGHYGSNSPAEGLRINCARLSAIGLVTLG